jgi:hypothetical protein
MRNKHTVSLADTINKAWSKSTVSTEMFIASYPGSFDHRANEFFMVDSGNIAQCYLVGNNWYVKY